MMNSKSKTRDNKPSVQELPLLQPLSLTATSGDIEGEIDLAWEPVSGAHTYIIQKSSDVKEPVKWVFEDVVTRSSYTITKLKSKHIYWFRVAAVGASGQSNWSNSVQKKAP